MKKLSALLIAVTMVFCLCACESNTIEKDGEFNPDSYISEAQLSVFINYVNLNQEFYNDVFVLGHLEADTENVIEKDGKKWAPVTDTTYKSYDEFVEALYGTYTDEAVQKILSEYPIYADIDGTFCYDMSDAENTRTGRKWVLNTDGEIELEEKSEDSYTVEFRFTCDKRKEIDEFTFVRVGDGINEGYRLTELHEVT